MGFEMVIDPPSDPGDGNPQAETHISNAQTRFAKSARAPPLIRDGMSGRPGYESELDDTDLQRLEGFT
jgi:hypothetical protein